MKPLNILVVVGGFPIVSQTFIVNQIVSLIDEGHNVSLYSLKAGDGNKVHNNVISYKLLDKVTYRQKIPVNKIKKYLFLTKWFLKNILTINYSLLFKTFQLFRNKNGDNLNTIFDSLYFLVNNNFDIIHAHFGQNAVSIAELKEKGFLRKSKLIVSFHGFDLNPSKTELYKSLYKQLFKQAAYLTVNTIYTKNILLDVNEELNNIFILPESLDTNLFKKKNSKIVNNDIFNIVYCGRLVPFKGSLLLPKIIDELKNRGFNFIELKVIGDGILMTELDLLIKKMNLQDTIILVGTKKQNEIIEIFSTSNIFLLPGIKSKEDNRAENQGLVIQEAAAMELPVVVSDAGGMKYGLIPNKTGFVVNENDIEGFVNAIQRLIEQPDLAIKMGQKGREYVVENYNSKILVKKLIDIYRK